MFCREIGRSLRFSSILRIRANHNQSQYYLQLQSFAENNDTDGIAKLLLSRYHIVTSNKSAAFRASCIVRDAAEASVRSGKMYDSTILCDILEKVSYTMPDAAKIGLEKLIRRNISANQASIVIDICNRMFKLKFQPNTALAEHALSYFGCIGRSDGVLAMSELCDTVTAPMLQAIVQPLFMSGYFAEFCSYFVRYLLSKSPPSPDEVTIIIQNIILADCRCFRPRSFPHKLAILHIARYVEVYLDLAHDANVDYSPIKTSLQILNELANDESHDLQSSIDDVGLMIPIESDHVQLNFIHEDAEHGQLSDLTMALNKEYRGIHMLFAGSLFPNAFNFQYREAIQKVEKNWGVLFHFDKYRSQTSHDVSDEDGNEIVDVERQNKLAEIINDASLDFDFDEDEDEEDSSEFDDSDVNDASDDDHDDDEDESDFSGDMTDDEDENFVVNDRVMWSDQLLLMSERLNSLGAGDFRSGRILDISQQLNSDIVYSGSVFARDSTYIAEEPACNADL